MNRRVFYISILLTFLSCGIDDWKIDSLYMQKIEGTSKVIYNFSAWGGLDSNPHGFIILDSTKTFKVDVKNILPMYELSNIPTANKIEGITHECYGTCGEPYYKSPPIYKPMKTETFENEDINITNRIYQYKGYSELERGLERYVFERFIETRDSLFFFNLDDVESMDGIHLDELRVKKGQIYLQFYPNKEVKKIIVDDVTLNPKTKSVEQIRHIHLTPKNKILNKQISERGVFREIEIPK